MVTLVPRLLHIILHNGQICGVCWCIDVSSKHRHCLDQLTDFDAFHCLNCVGVSVSIKRTNSIISAIYVFVSQHFDFYPLLSFLALLMVRVEAAEMGEGINRR